jgi:hypothetical protein
VQKEDLEEQSQIQERTIHTLQDTVNVLKKEMHGLQVELKQARTGLASQASSQLSTPTKLNDKRKASESPSRTPSKIKAALAAVTGAAKKLKTRNSSPKNELQTISTTSHLDEFSMDKSMSTETEDMDIVADPQDLLQALDDLYPPEKTATSSQRSFLSTGSAKASQSASTVVTRKSGSPSFGSVRPYHLLQTYLYTCLSCSSALNHPSSLLTTVLKAIAYSTIAGKVVRRFHSGLDVILPNAGTYLCFVGHFFRDCPVFYGRSTSPANGYTIDWFKACGGNTQNLKAVSASAIETARKRGADDPPQREGKKLSPQEWYTCVNEYLENGGLPNHYTQMIQLQHGLYKEDHTQGFSQSSKALD